jgi:hypothetical protein
MKRRHIRLTTATTVALLLSGFAARVLAYPTIYGPFPPGLEPAAISLDKCELVREVKPSAADSDDNAGASGNTGFQQSGKVRSKSLPDRGGPVCSGQRGSAGISEMGLVHEQSQPR